MNGFMLHMNGQQLVLLPRKAVFWVERNTLLLADPHFGKIRHFRGSGVAVSSGASSENFSLLTGLLKEWKPQRVIFLGDLFHSRYNLDWDLLMDLLKHWSKSTRFLLVRGNHDILPATSYPGELLPMEAEILREPPFLLSHKPIDPLKIDPGEIQISGHLHPGVLLRGPARQYEKLPCYYLRQQRQLILPAFGNFTGLHPIQPGAGDRVFAVYGDLVKEFSF